MFKQIFFAFILLSLAACTSVAPTPVPTPQPTSTFTPQPTSTPQPTATNTPIPSPTPTATPLPLGDLNAKGTIWVKIRGGYLLVDLDRRSTHKTTSEGCGGLLPFTTISVCDYSAKPFWIDLLTNKTQDLPRLGTGWLEPTSNGMFLFYEINDKQNDQTVFASYDLLTQTYQNLTSEIPNSDRKDWLEFPKLSSDGQHLVVTKFVGPWNYQIFEIIKGTNRYKQISFVQLMANVLKVWSPVSSQLLFGGTDLKVEIGGGYVDTNYLYLADFATGQVMLLSRAPRNGLYAYFGGDNDAWSPNGKQIAVPTQQNELCVITVSSKSQNCYQVSLGFRKSTWSPDGKYIALVQSGSQRYDVVVLDPENGKRWIILEGIDIDTGFRNDNAIYWR